jgi:hypothetical protein
MSRPLSRIFRSVIKGLVSQLGRIFAGGSSLLFHPLFSSKDHLAAIATLFNMILHSFKLLVKLNQAIFVPMMNHHCSASPRPADFPFGVQSCEEELPGFPCFW